MTTTTNPLQKAFADLHKQVKDCRACVIRDFCTSPVPFAGNLSSKIMFIARNPSDYDDLHGFPLMHHNTSQGYELGGVLTEILKKMSLSRSEIYATTLMKCSGSSHRLNRQVKETELNYCGNQFLKLEIFMLCMQMKLIVTFGKEPLAYLSKLGNSNFLKEKGIKDLVGEGYDLKFPSLIPTAVKVFPLLHPGFLTHQPYAAKKYMENIDALANLWKSLI